MILNDLIKIIETHYPKNLAYEWDNPGLIFGDKNQEIKKVMVSLDITNEILDEAIDLHVDCIVSHHPIIFQGIKQINADTYEGEILLKAAKHNISLYAAHTNMDVAKDGINKKLSEMFFLKNVEIIEPIENKEEGLGVIGEITALSLCDFLEIVKDVLKTPHLRFSGCENQIIKKVAIGSGACSDLIEKAKSMGADTIITGDLKYHTCLTNTSASFSIIDAGHFPTEQIVRDMFLKILSPSGIEIVKSTQQDIFKFA